MARRRRCPIRTIRCGSGTIATIHARAALELFVCLPACPGAARLPAGPRPGGDPHPSNCGVYSTGHY
eukprot:1901130-Rhodomonas_salina.1